MECAFQFARCDHLREAILVDLERNEIHAPGNHAAAVNVYEGVGLPTVDTKVRVMIPVDLIAAGIAQSEGDAIIALRLINAQRRDGQVAVGINLLLVQCDAALGGKRAGEVKVRYTAGVVQLAAHGLQFFTGVAAGEREGTGQSKQKSKHTFHCRIPPLFLISCIIPRGQKGVNKVALGFTTC